MVEMAVCFPIFMLMLLGIIEFGRAMMVSQLLTASAREACREAIIDSATDASVSADIVNRVTTMVGCTSTDVTVDIAVSDATDGTALTGIDAANKRDIIEIDITVPFDAVSFTSGRFLNGAALRGQCAIRKE